jgi:hypothetical protein
MRCAKTESDLINAFAKMASKETDYFAMVAKSTEKILVVIRKKVNFCVKLKDIDECARNADNCSSKAYCINTYGGFKCTCMAGFTGDGIYCRGKLTIFFRFRFSILI